MNGEGEGEKKMIWRRRRRKGDNIWRGKRAKVKRRRPRRLTSNKVSG